MVKDLAFEEDDQVVDSSISQNANLAENLAAIDEYLKQF